MKTNLTLAAILMATSAFMPMSYETEQAQKAAKHWESVAKQKPEKQVYISKVSYPPDTGGLCVKNSLGTQFAGVNGYVNGTEKRKCEDE